MINQENFKKAQELMHEVNMLKTNKRDIELLLGEIENNPKPHNKYSLIRDAHLSYAKEVMFFEINEEALLVNALSLVDAKIEEKLAAINAL
jgi:hypothetical protein